jgi:hypothetical protein
LHHGLAALIELRGQCHSRQVGIEIEVLRRQARQCRCPEARAGGHGIQGAAILAVHAANHAFTGKGCVQELSQLISGQFSPIVPAIGAHA